MSKEQSILIVDDRPQNLLALQRTLSELDVTLVKAEGGNEALAATLDHDFALAILDVQMPEMDGFEVAALMRKDARTQHVPIIFLTAAYGAEDKVFSGYEAGAVDYIVKPYNEMVLLAKTRVFLELDALRRELVKQRQHKEVLVEARTKELRDSQEQFQSAFQHAVIGMALVAPDGRWINANEALCRMLGYSEDEMQARRCQEVTHPDDLELDLDHVRRVLAGEITTYQIEKRYIHRSGRIVWVFLGLSLVRDGQGQPMHFITQIQDITERRRLEAEASHRLAKLTLLHSWGERFVATTDRQAIAKDLVRLSVQDFHVVFAWLGKLDPDGSIGGLAMHPDLPLEWRKPAFRWRTPSITQGPIAEAWQTGRHQVVVVPVEELQDPGARSEFMKAGASSIALLPLMGPGATGKFLILGGPTPDFFDADRVETIQACAHFGAMALEKARLLAEAQGQLSRLESLRKIDLAITGSLDLRVTLDVFLNQLMEQLKCDAACVRLLDPHSLRLELGAYTGMRDAPCHQHAVRVGEGHSGTAAVERRGVFVPDLSSDPGEFATVPGFAEMGFGSLHAIPLIAKGHVKGVIEVFHRKDAVIDQDRMLFLEALAGQAAIAIDNASLFSDLVRSNDGLVMAYETTLEGWSRALDLRDKETEGHSLRVTAMTAELAKRLDMPAEDQLQARRGALLHDIGKLGVPDAILLKPGPLTDEEWVVMKRHPVYALELLSPIAFLRQAIDIPYGHHEKWDGSGYPRGLKGEQIPLAARIFAPIDVWDALVNDRPYRAAMPKERAIEIIRKGVGTHFDPRVAEVFLDLKA